MAATPAERQQVLDILTQMAAALNKVLSDDSPMVMGGPPVPTVGECCTACAALATGKWGIPWFRASDQTWQCTQAVPGKILGATADEPEWINPP